MNLKEENKHNAVARVFAPAEVRSRVWPVIGAAIVALLAGGYAAHSWFSGGIEKAVQVKTQLSTADNSGHPDPLTEALLLARDAQRKNDWGRVVSILEDAFAETGVETHPRRGEAEELLALARRRFADRQNAAEKIFEAENFIAAEKFSEARAALSAARVLWADVPRANEVEKLLNTGNKEVRFAQAETLRLQARAMQPNITPVSSTSPKWPSSIRTAAHVWQ